ncbi:hypothetical protein OS175_13590 [Marinicella sp. S1101]|uniref:hypothetical protein n=1 Tax=Marinicella marina TaxID=2996016 RepID=UPI002260DDB0|nr:hypothetical protein [Marinicella marina]MCX7554907.1 hypothetical protein [Marinicella marina]MDJ1141269.1 hypothetical protein [Marinicella marina]
MQHIICTASELVSTKIKGDGFIKTNEQIFDLNQLWIGPRPHLEEDENFKQIIPYVILSYQGKIAVYQRTKKGGESRLHNLNSIGFGGHIDAFDLAYDTQGVINLDKTIETSAQREIDEELIVSEIISKTHLGYILDNSNPVGRVHIGVVERWELASPEVRSNEDQIKVLGLFELDAIKALDEAMENWSEHIVNGL